jgi:hypothetical protein
MFEYHCSDFSFKPFLKGIVVMTAVVGIAMAGARVSTRHTRDKAAPEKTVTVVSLYIPPKFTQSKGHLSGEPRDGSSAAEDQLVASPLRPDWVRHVAHGRGVDYAVVAYDGLPVLRSFGVLLAFDTGCPQGNTYLFNPQTGATWIGPVPPGRLVRELENVSAPDIDKAKRQVENTLGAPVRVFALWDEGLYMALKGLTDATLRKAGIEPTGISQVNVQLHLTRPREFTVALKK